MFKIEITTSGIAAIGKQGYREVGRAAILAAATYWFKEYLPLHFQNIAYRRYGYKTRSKSYDESKAKRRKYGNLNAIGEVKPLVFTGRSRAFSLHQRNIKAKAKDFETYRADVIINAPAFNFGIGKRIDMRDEVTRLTAQEITTLEKVFSAEWEKQLIAKGAAAPRRKRLTRAA